MNKKVLASVVGIITLLVLGFEVYSLTRPSEPNEPIESTSSNETEATEAPQVGGEVTTTESATITYSNNGFSPSTLTVKKDSLVRVVNNSSDSLEFSSDNHPTHLDNSELNMDVLAPGEGGTFTVSRTGEFGFHDHLNACNEGILTVTE